MTRHPVATIRFLATILLVSLLAAPTLADSHVRAVRLSSIEGDVQIDRNTGGGFEKAFINIPLIEGARIHTGVDGRAEIELENGSTIRLAPETTTVFSELSLRESGAKVTHVTLLEGTAYVTYREDKQDEFRLAFAREVLALAEPARLRVQMKDAEATAAVFKGKAEIDGASGHAALGKGQSISFDLASHDQYALADKVEEDPSDDWDKDQEQYHDKYLSKKTSAYANGYGASDLNYYGSFSNLPGYGMLWQPYFVGAGWDPFMDGAWAWYPGAGYVWVSAYPWGWTPYRCGSWMFVQSFGWGWQPGSCFGWGVFPSVINPPRQFVRPVPPANAGNGPVWRRKPLTSTITRLPYDNKIRIKSDSAGLGIPRGGVKNLGTLSREVNSKGSVTTNLQMRTPAPTANPAATRNPTTRPAPGSRTATPRTAPAPRPAPMPRSSPPRSAPTRPK
jgi:hypothetical protein